MIRFECDYLEGAAPQILEAIAQANYEQNPGYGCDPHTERACELIREACKTKDIAVCFVVGGTQANLTVIGAALKNYQGVIAPVTSHINTHEAGAIELTGHKVISVSSPDGKIRPEQVEKRCKAYTADAHRTHLVQPGMVYISQTTEVGTLYTKAEVKALHDVCKKYGLFLFLDGARLGYAVESPGNDLTLEDLPHLCDVFTIGGTKQGALFGEAAVIVDEELKCEFPYHIKQRGALLAKGWLLGIQYETLFTDNLYFRLARHAADLAVKMHKGFKEAGFDFLHNHETNQQLPIFTQTQFDKLKEKGFYFDHFADMKDGRIVTRFCTSWATDPANVDKLLEAIKDL